ncbi:DUF4249 domain-containing protein [Hymenobacter sp. BT186]|uniref:DUF4249 domain-containing protein n=1 Tax=Hymenobacter telluris TaxID=2816474 RepID=A0A939EUN5_9BACT|nr:DUF4249 domain-containing protein [Hymenobacter telluris]MBO0357542.1 DUF4249 domain-containing protein [Hymenobacter telluris]MBW3373568.1 DUF4249 domain-containing protein [Hymenobacter norwichensis]
MKNILALCCAALAFSSCETIVDVDVPPHTPRLALTYTLSNQPPAKFFEVRNLFVSTSQGVLELKDPVGRGDATVEIFNEAGQVVERFRSKGQPGFNSSTGQPDSLYGYYVPTRNFGGQPGSTYTLRASAPGVEAVEATLTLPARAVIETGSFVATNPVNPNSRGINGRFRCSILDNAATTDYYLVYARVLDRNGEYWGEVQYDYNSPSNGSNSDINLNRYQLSEARGLYSQYPFSDVGGNGQRLAVSNDVYLNGGGVLEPAFIEVTVSSITPDTYRFYQSLQRYYNTDGNPFAEPAPLFSNIRPGYGLFGGATDVTYRIPL